MTWRGLSSPGTATAIVELCGDAMTRSVLYRLAVWSASISDRSASLMSPNIIRLSVASLRVVALGGRRHVEQHLAAAPARHRGEPCLEVLEGQLVRDDGRDVETALQHGLHLVPGLPDLASVDALYREPAEHDLVPGDTDRAGSEPQERDPAAVVHALEHRLERARVAAHLEADVEADHAEVLPHARDRVAAHVHGPRGAHAQRQVQAIVVDVRDHDVARAHVLGDGDGHDADRPRARDEHVLTDEIERERRMRRVTEGVEDRGDARRDGVRDVPRVGRREREVLREAAVPVHADSDRVGAQEAPPSAAAAAEAADDVSLAGDALVDAEAADAFADLRHVPHELVPEDLRRTDGALRPRVPVPDVHIGAADGDLLDADQQIAGADPRNGHLFERGTGSRRGLHQSLHHAFHRERPICQGVKPAIERYRAPPPTARPPSGTPRRTTPRRSGSSRACRSWAPDCRRAGSGTARRTTGTAG